MASAEFHQILDVNRDKLYSVITRYEDYPEFLEGCTSTQVERKSDAVARVVYKVSMMKNVTYTLDHKEDSQAKVVEWALVDSDFFKKNTGRWELKEAGKDKTDVLYTVEVEFKIPVPGLILNRLVKGSLPTMVKSFQKQAQKKG